VKYRRNMPTLIGPFRQLLTMRNLPIKGALKDDALEIIPEGGIIIDGDIILDVGNYEELYASYSQHKISVERIEEDLVALPGFIDAHTHICFGGSRAMDFAARNAGVSYLEIAKAGGGIWSTVKHTRAADLETLTALTKKRMDTLLQNGITTVEVKSGYGLGVAEEYKMLKAIQKANSEHYRSCSKN